MGDFDAAVVQQKPVGQGQDVAHAAVADIKVLGFYKVAEDLEARIRFGEKKYGTRLQTHNGRDALLDCYQEALDGVNYSKQAQLEGLDDGGLFQAFLDLSVIIERKLKK